MNKLSVLPIPGTCLEVVGPVQTDTASPSSVRGSEKDHSRSRRQRRLFRWAVHKLLGLQGPQSPHPSMEYVPEVGAPEAYPETRTQEQVMDLGRFPEAPGGSQEVRQERGGGQPWMGQGAGDPCGPLGLHPAGDLAGGCKLQLVGPVQPASCFCEESSHRVRTQALSCGCCLWPLSLTQQN